MVGLLLDARFNGPMNLAYDQTNRMYVSDVRNNAIRKIDVHRQLRRWYRPLN